MADWWEQHDAVVSLAKKLDMMSISKMGRVCKFWKYILHLRHANLADVLHNFRDDAMTARYNSDLEIIDRFDYNQRVNYEKRHNKPPAYTDFYHWKYTHDRDDEVIMPDHVLLPCPVPPLHVALRNNVSCEIVLNLIKSDMQALKVRDVYGNYPLHLAARYGNWPPYCAPRFGECNSVIYAILDGFEDATNHANVEGEYPLHLIVKRDALTEGTGGTKNPPTHVIVKRIIAASRTTATENTSYGYNALFIAFQYTDDRVIEEILNAYVEAAKIPDEDDNFYPLHKAIEWRCSTHTILELVNACKDAVSARVIHDGFGNTINAIHMAILHSASANVIQCLVDLHPECTKWIYNTGESYDFGNTSWVNVYTPIQLAAEYGYKEAFDILLEKNPASVLEVQARCGRTLLHFAIDGIFAPEASQYTRKDIIMTLIHAYEDATTKRNSVGHLPVDSLLCIPIPKGNYTHFDIILTLIRMYITQNEGRMREEVLRDIKGELERCEQMAGTHTLLNVDCLSAMFKKMREDTCGSKLL